MKKLLLVLCVLLIAPSIRAQVWLPMSMDLLNLESFRHQATASIEDDLDNGIDGTDIFKVNGARIYTNLSNLVSGTEEQADNMSSDQTVLIGGTSPLYKGWKVTGFYGNGNLNESLNEETIENDQWSTDADEEFDYTSLGVYKGTYGMESSSNTILLNIGKQLGEETEVAFTYKRIGYTDKSESRDSAFYREYDIDDGEVDEIWREFADTNSSMTMPISEYSLSYSKPFMNWKLRGDVFYMTGGLDILDEEFGYFWEDEMPYDPGLTFVQLDSVMNNMDISVSANIMGLGLRLSDMNEQTGLLWEVGGNFAMIGGSGDVDMTERVHSISQDENVVDEISVLDTLYINSTTGPLSPSGSSMGINARIEWQISENVRFGIGGMYNTMTASIDGDIAERLDIVSTFDDDDGAGSDADDYTITVNGEDTDITLNAELSANRIAIPAGVEVNFGKNKDWFLRLGAIAVGSKTEMTMTTTVDSITPYTRLEERGDGSSTETIADQIYYEDMDINNSTTSQTVDYVYGLGWKPSPNLSLDLIGMFDFNGVELLSTDWLKTLKLSATINVY